MSRLFDDVDDMDEVLISNWNDKVGENDVVFFLGDFTLERHALNYWKQLNGKVYCCWLPCHHDRRWQNAAARYWAPGMIPAGLYDGKSMLVTASGWPVSVFAEGTVVTFRMDTGEKKRITLQHYPLVEWNGSYYPGNWQLHGHTHGTYVPDSQHGFAYDVGVDTNGLAPVSLGDIVSAANHWESIREKYER